MKSWVVAAGLIFGLSFTDSSLVNAETASGTSVNLLTLNTDFTAAETARILQHGPWPVAWSPDPSNRVSGKPEAIAFGKTLFFDPRLSANGKSSCSTCHLPELGFADGRARGEGFVQLDRNTPGLLNVRLNRWFGKLTRLPAADGGAKGVSP